MFSACHVIIFSQFMLYVISYLEIWKNVSQSESGTSGEKNACIVAQPEWGRRDHAPPRNKLAKILTGDLYQFLTVRK